MEKLKRMQTKKSYSWWWDSHISRRNSKWLAESLAEMDQSVKEMLTLIEEEGDSFAKKAEMYYAKRPELISHVEDFYRMYRALAERYDQVTGKLRKTIKSELKAQNSAAESDSVIKSSSPTDLQSPEITPMSKSRYAMLNTRAAGFDVFLGSDGSSDVAKKSSDDSSSSSSSDSESDMDDPSEINGDGDYSMLQQRILELEQELHEVKEKLKIEEDKFHHEDISYMENGNHSDLSTKISEMEEQLSEANKKLDISEMEILDLRKKLEDSAASLEAVSSELTSEKEKVFYLENQIVLLQGEISGYKQETEQLKEAAEAATAEFQSYISRRNDQIEQCKAELIVVKEKYLQEKAIFVSRITDLEDANVALNVEVDKYSKEVSILEARILELEHVIHDLKASNSSFMEKLMEEKSAFETDILVLSQSKASLEAEVAMLSDQISKLDADRSAAVEDHVRHINELNQNMDALKLNVDTLMSEKMELAANLSERINDLKRRDDKIHEMDQHLQQLHLEHVKLITDIESAKKSSSELQMLVKELEDEIEKQKVAVSDSAEGKREAIRQLCFSLEHYRDGYNELRQLLQGHKRSVVLAS